MFVFFWLICGMFFTLAWVISFATYWHGCRCGSKFWRWLGGVPLAALSLVVLLTVGGFVLSVLFPTPPSDDFKTTFGFEPPADVTNLQSYRTSFGDTGQGYMAFQAAPGTIKKIAASGLKRLSPASEKAARKTLPPIPEDAPGWWQPSATPNLQIYHAEDRLHHFYSEDEVLYFDPPSGQAYYRYRGVD